MFGEAHEAEPVAVTKADLVRRLLAHQLVVEETMKLNPTVLPVKFGTVLASRDEAYGLLAQGKIQFEASLAWLADKVEMEVAAVWDKGRILRRISASETIAQAKAEIERRSGGRPTREDCLALGRLVEEEMNRRRQSYQAKAFDSLRCSAIEVHPNPLVSDDMVLNASYLVEKGMAPQFEERVASLDGLFEAELNWRLIGPLPAYSFATVEVSRPKREEIEQARHVLSLGDVFCEGEVRAAYRHLAAIVHPDRNPGDSAARDSFVRLRQATTMLLDYCRGQGAPGSGFLIAINHPARGMERSELELAGV